MVRYSYEKWLRYTVGIMAFAMALLLTPRVLIEVAEPANSHEIPVHMLENPDDCLWCTPVFEPAACDELFFDEEETWHPDELPLQAGPCVDDAVMEDRSA